MPKLTALFRLTLIVLLAGAGLGGCADFKKEQASYDRVDHATILHIWKPLAEQGDVDAQNDLGMMYAEGVSMPQDQEMAAQWFRRAAEQGYAAAQFNLGVMYEEGRGVPQDDKVAAQWYKRAAEQGYAVAQFNLGGMYKQGRGMPRDDKMAAQWYKRAAEQGHGDAQFLLGTMYDEGRGVSKDFIYAHMWINIAFGEYADIFLQPLEKKMTPSQIAEAQELARECVRKAYKDC